MTKTLWIATFAGAALLCGCPKKSSGVADAGGPATASAAAPPTANAPGDIEDAGPPVHAHGPKDVPGHHEADKKAEGEISKANYKSVLDQMEKKTK
jgi:hypothetical protein